MRQLSCVRDRRKIHLHFTSRAVRRNRAFTLIELLVVVAIVFILFAMIGPVRHHPGRSPGVQCLSNMRQLVLGWVMYATDNQDSLMGNEPYHRSTDVPT